MGPYKIHRKSTEYLIIRDITTIYPVIGWFEITEYNDKKAMKIANLRNYVAGTISTAKVNHAQARRRIPWS